MTVKKVFIISYFFIVFKTKKPDVCINLWFNVSGHPYCHSADIPEDTVFMMLSYSVVVSVYVTVQANRHSHFWWSQLQHFHASNCFTLVGGKIKIDASFYPFLGYLCNIISRLEKECMISFIQDVSQWNKRYKFQIDQYFYLFLCLNIL